MFPFKKKKGFLFHLKSNQCSLQETLMHFFPTRNHKKLLTMDTFRGRESLLCNVYIFTSYVPFSS